MPIIGPLLGPEDRFLLRVEGLLFLKFLLFINVKYINLKIPLLVYIRFKNAYKGFIKNIIRIKKGIKIYYIFYN